MPECSAERLSRPSASACGWRNAESLGWREPVLQADPDWAGSRCSPQQEPFFSPELAEMLAIAMMLVGLSGCFQFNNLTSLTWPIGPFQICLPASEPDGLR
jgi:hypothetical protein